MFKKILILYLTIIISFHCTVAKAQLCPGAQSAILIETSSNTVIYEKNSRQRLPMASTTKIMTALCAIEQGDLDKQVTADNRAVGVEGSSIYLTKGEILTLRDLIYGLMLHSGNDAAVAIACEISGSSEDFAKLMNDTAKKIGALDTNFENPNGLDGKNHYTTAYDLAIITSYALKNPEFAKIVSTYKTTIPSLNTKERYLKNHNKLLRLYEGCTGVKTGFTKKSGRCLVSSARKDNTELVAVTLNDGNDWNDHMQMLDYGFENTHTRLLIKKGDYMCRVMIDKGTSDTADILCGEDVYITEVYGKASPCKIEYDIPKKIKAPVQYGQQTGNITIHYGNNKQFTIPAISSVMIAKKPAFPTGVNFVKLLKLWLEPRKFEQHMP